jgi:hypothetical protein
MQNEDRFPQYWVPQDLAGSWLSETEIREPPLVTLVRPRNARVAQLMSSSVFAATPASDRRTPRRTQLRLCVSYT